VAKPAAFCGGGCFINAIVGVTANYIDSSRENPPAISKDWKTYSYDADMLIFIGLLERQNDEPLIL
jgi:hypothetical protein